MISSARVMFLISLLLKHTVFLALIVAFRKTDLCLKYVEKNITGISIYCAMSNKVLFVFKFFFWAKFAQSLFHWDLLAIVFIFSCLDSGLVYSQPRLCQSYYELSVVGGMNISWKCTFPAHIPDWSRIPTGCKIIHTLLLGPYDSWRFQPPTCRWYSAGQSLPYLAVHPV